jgi:hypothetical protein
VHFIQNAVDSHLSRFIEMLKALNFSFLLGNDVRLGAGVFECFFRLQQFGLLKAINRDNGHSHMA